MDPELLERITSRRAELDELGEQLAKQLAEVGVELAIAERVLERVSEQLADERASAATAPGQVGGRTVMLIPHRRPDMEETLLPPDCQRIHAAVRQAAGPVMARHAGEMLGVDITMRAKLEPLRRQVGQTRRPRLAAQTARRPLHHPPTGDAISRSRVPQA
jgi:hypothetical protein